MNENNHSEKAVDEQPKQEFKPSQKPKEKTGLGGPSKNTIAMLTYLVFFLPWVMKMDKDDYVKYHLRQALGFLIVAAVLRGFLAFLTGPPMALCLSGGCALSYLLLQPAHLVLLALLGYGMFNAYKGEKKPLWFIGEYADRAFKNL